MPFEVGILIKSEADLAALKLSEEATQKLRAEMQKLGTTAQQTSQQTRLIGPGFIETAQAMGRAGATMADTKIKAAGLSTAVAQLGMQLGAVGGAGSIAGAALSAMTTAGFAAVAPMATLAATIALVTFRISKARERFAELAEIELAQIARATGQLKAEFDVRKSLQLVEADGDRVRELGVAQAHRRIDLEKQGVDQARIAKLEKAELNRLLKDELSAIGRMDATTAINTQIRKENALAAAQQAGASKEVTAALKAEVEAAKARIGAIDAKELTALGGPEGKAILGQIAEVTAKIQAAAKGGFISPTEIAQLKGAVEGISQAAIQKWGTEVPAAVEAGLAKVSAKIDQLAAIKQISPIEVNAEQPFREMAAIEAKAAALRAMLSAPIVMTAIAKQTGSPTLPFSEYWESYAPDVIAKFAGRVAGTELNLNSPFIGVMQENLAKIVELRALIGRASGVTGSPHVIGDLSAQARGELAERMAFMAEFARAAARGGAAPAGGGGNINITIDASDLLNGLERTVRTTTGQTLNIRVLN